MIEFILASGNKHKAEEFEELFDPSNILIRSPSEVIEVDECGSSFSENALIKAKAYYEFHQKPVLADDSGLTVPALPQDLGIYSNRFGGGGLSYQEKNNLLLQKMSSFVGQDRYAFFSCVLCAYLSHSEIFFFEGKVDGSIGNESRGVDGFGYDPIFYPKALSPGVSFAMDASWKAENSHRAIACQNLENFFRRRDERNCQN